MPGFARRPIAIFVCCIFAGTQIAHAATPASRLVLPAIDDNGMPIPPKKTGEAPILLATSDPGVRLRVERKFNLLAPKPKTLYDNPTLFAKPVEEKLRDSYPAFLIADQIEGRNDEVTEAEGDAELRRPNQLLLADKITFWSLEDEVEATGHVRLTQNEDEISGPHMRMKMAEQIGFFEEADYKLRKDVINRFYKPIDAMTTVVNATTTTGGAPMMLYVPRSADLPTSVPPRRPSDGYGHAKRVDFEGENQVHMTDATYSTCKPGDTDWFLRGEEFRLDYDREVGEAKNATLYFKDVPIFYTPSGSFSLNHQRQSGFLPANMGASTRNGFDLTTPYYWNIAPNYDATFYPRVMSKRGFQLGSELNYVDYNFSGTTRFEVLPEDSIENRSRYAYNLKHFQNFGQGLSAMINWNGVSDDRYWQDFSSRLLQTSQAQLPQQMLLQYNPGSWWNANLQFMRYQTLQPDPANPISRPYTLEPQINFLGRKANALALNEDLTLLGQHTRFTHSTLVEGSRTVAYPQLAFPILDPSYTIIPKFGLHATQYALDRQAPGDPASFSRVLPTFTFDSSLTFERDAQWLGASYIQTLEPRLFYVYIPYKDQSKVPVFDSGIADFNFAQVFSENRYTGHDRINDANQLTAALTSRFLDSDTGAERFKGMIGQRYYFAPQKVSIPGETVRQKDFSNLVAAFTGTVFPKTYVDTAWEYNYNERQTERFSAGARYQPELSKVLSASYRYTRDPYSKTPQVDQIDIAAQWPLTSKWHAVGRYNYSMRDKQILEVIAGLEYNAGCWAARGVIQRLEAVAGVPNTTFFFQLELNDFASVGSNPINLLRRTIPGYGKINEMPISGGSLLTTP